MVKYFSVIMLCLTIESAAQKTFSLQDLFKQDTVVWFGIDYSQSRFIGTFEGKDLRDYFVGWNRLILEEPYKYDLRAALRKRSVKFDVGSVERINASSVPNINPASDSTLKSSALGEIITRYESVHDEGIGVVLIADRYVRPRSVATHFLVIFDIASRKILLHQKYSTIPDGTGVRNYWARTIYRSINLLGKSYKKWEKKFAH